MKVGNSIFETNGQGDEIEGGATAIGDEGVGNKPDPPAGVDVEIPLRRGDNDVSAGAAEDVDDDDGLHRLRAVGNRDEDLRSNFRSIGGLRKLERREEMRERERKKENSLYLF